MNITLNHSCHGIDIQNYKLNEMKRKRKHQPICVDNDCEFAQISISNGCDFFFVWLMCAFM